MKRGSYARRACNHCRKRYAILRQWDATLSPTLNTHWQEIKVRWLRADLRILQSYWT